MVKVLQFSTVGSGCAYKDGRFLSGAGRNGAVLLRQQQLIAEAAA